MPDGAVVLAVALAALGGCGRLAFEALGDAEIASDAALDAGADGLPFTPWSILQAVGTPSGTVALAPTQPGSLLVVAIEFGPGGVSSVVDNAAGGGDTFTRIPSSQALDPTGGGIEIWYAANGHGAATSLVVTLSTGFPNDAVWEVAGIATSAPLDSAAALSNQPATTMPVGPQTTATAAGDLIIAAANLAGSVSSVLPSFTDDVVLAADGWAHLALTNAPPDIYQAIWTASSGTYTSTSAAFFVAH